MKKAVKERRGSPSISSLITMPSMLGGKHADIAYAYKKRTNYYFDFPRTMEEHTPYDLVEKFKDGLVFSSKYESTLKVFKNPKVLVCSNFRPIESKLSADRWNIITLN